MKDEDKAVPFFMLDELTANTHHDDQGKKFAAFQRNVFRACGLVLVVMGTDAKIGNLIHQSGGSSEDRGTLWEKTPSVSNDFKYYENMVAHMIFVLREEMECEVSFLRLLPLVLGEFQDRSRIRKLMMDEEEMAFSGLLDGYNELAQLPGKNVPFLAPPNAEWPPYILGADWGCFGHLDRLKNEEG
ncbi:hypothetical protein GQ600_2212 [Phytophthora cactorum]|nr:hypothetical protein GQ600_2212 [Phytophthora cactorum]